MKVTLEGPGEVSLFLYDNNSFVVESFLDHEVIINVLIGTETKEIVEIPTENVIAGMERKAPVFRNRKFGVDASVFEITIKPHSFRAFKY